jgi:hypothetical protein
LPKGTFAVALTAADESELFDLAATLTTRDIPHARIVESEGPHAGQLMAVGIAPCDRERVRKLLSWLPLLKERKCRCRDEEGGNY